MTTTKLTRPSKYDVFITGRLNLDGGEQEDIVSRPITVKVDEVGAGNAEAAFSSLALVAGASSVWPSRRSSHKRPSTAQSRPARA